ncbi:MAG: class II fructose-bisphosphate aldolase [Clostridia bacterium]|jgi:ketose-bisphosphate aldolase|nr:class II fructose-bisphosphate aldolase [Bacillota bacterium]MCR4723875.1 class II fructose-bisphosphate aldolase [Clostridia bacterium]
MLVNMIDMLAKAAAEGYGVGNFDVFNTELLKGVMEAAEEANAPVILAYGPPFEKYSPLKYFAPAVKAWAADTDLPVVLHYDHGTSLEGCVHAVECGCNSIMIDASSKPFEENVKTVREVVDFCHPRGIPVEAELGHVGDEGEYSLENYGYTDPMQAKEFVLRTGVDFLAVAIGNQHGVYTAEPKINYDVLQAVREAVDVPLVLHGASGIPAEDIRRCCREGITKINIHTDMLLEAIATLKADLAAGEKSYHTMSAHHAAAVKKVALEKMRLFGSEGKGR